MKSRPFLVCLPQIRQEGFFHAQDIPDSPNRGSSNFQQIVDAFMGQDGAAVLRRPHRERIEHAFARHGGLFGQHGVYSTPIVLWAFLSQVLRDGKEAACQSAVAEITTYCLHPGIQPPTEDTGDYCKARAKLSEAALHELGKEVADELQQRADESWLWKGRHAKLVDGFTFTMPATPKNLAEFPHPRTQKKGVGLPIARVVAILSLATASVMDAAIGPYKGKETGESALLRTMLSSLHSADVAVFDRYYCSFLMIALLQLQGTDVYARLHQKRTVGFSHWQTPGQGRSSHRLDQARQAGLDGPGNYDRIPETLELRELRYTVVEKGRRTKTITVVTTLTDAVLYSHAEIAELYGFRWNSELDIRAIKSSLNLAHVRCKSPEMVRRELRTTLWPTT